MAIDTQAPKSEPKPWNLESSASSFISAVFFAAPFHDRECLQDEAAAERMDDPETAIETYRADVTQLLALIAPATVRRAEMLGQVLPLTLPQRDVIGPSTEQVLSVLRPIFEEAGIGDRLR